VRVPPRALEEEAGELPAALDEPVEADEEPAALGELDDEPQAASTSATIASRAAPFTERRIRRVANVVSMV
jgi:hypothetical protein